MAVWFFVLATLGFLATKSQVHRESGAGAVKTLGLPLDLGRAKQWQAQPRISQGAETRANSAELLRFGRCQAPV